MPARRFVLVGHPVGHSMSPVLHRAAYDVLGLADCTYELVDCPDETRVAEVVHRLRAGDVAGANVTVPWKQVALAMAEATSPLAQKTGAANVLFRDPRGRVVADNTDVLALADELRPHVGAGDAACVIGSGGAALASVVALESLGARPITVVARRFGQASDAERPFRELGALPTPWADGRSSDVSGRWQSARAVVQATSAGMKGADSGEGVRDIVPWDVLPGGAVCFDLVYNPRVTPFLEAARGRDLLAIDGLGMLVGQAARSIEIWLGRLPATAEMRAAAERALASRA